MASKKKPHKKTKPLTVPTVSPFTREERVSARNEAMRRYIADPKSHGFEFQTVALFQAQQTNGLVPSHGETGEAYLETLMLEARASQ